ncbi:Trp biosynthesis-associated membrane protein [Agromyces sp. SYSU T0242]|uniref:Trp biosynthesis-associated membrane protein n=1 Tax=Agromyces litoreus TaxID=3158561 RepID=UPI003391E120
MTGGRLKLAAILAILLGSGLALLAWSQAWYAVALVPGSAASGSGSLEVSGQAASPALSALALAGLALAGALTIAGPVIRIVLGVLAAVLGGCIVLAASISLADPVAAVSGAVADATGVAGAASTAELVDDLASSGWPVVALIGGVLVALAGVGVITTAGAWPTSRRYGGGVRMQPDDRGASAPSDRAVDDWDDLTRGDDPTDDHPQRGGATPTDPDVGPADPAPPTGGADTTR